MIQIGNIVRLKEEHHLSELIPGLCVVDEVRKFSFGKRPNRYHIKTLNTSDGSHRMTWIEEKEIISISEIRQERLNELGI
jgi:hypothetical protein